jgi:hypothetical protein
MTTMPISPTAAAATASQRRRSPTGRRGPLAEIARAGAASADFSGEGRIVSSGARADDSYVLPTSSRRFAFWLPALALLLIIAAAIPFAGAGPYSGKSDTSSRSPSLASHNTIEPLYVVSAGINGDIYPAIANFASSQKPRDRQMPTVSVKVTNTGAEMLKNRISVSIPGWSDQEIQMAEVAPGMIEEFLRAHLPVGPDALSELVLVLAE